MKRTRTYYLEEYVRKERSFRDIADEHNTYPNKIRREVIGFKIEPRDKSEAQSAALKSGRHEHPTRGKPRSDEVRQKISQTLSDRWDGLSDHQKAKSVSNGRETWDSLSDTKKQEIAENARNGLAKSRKEGSKLENFLNECLVQEGYIPRFHAVIPDSGFKYDIILDDNMVIIDVCGPTHFLPIFGDDALALKQENDRLKADFAVNQGYVFIKVVSMATTLSELDKATLKEIILSKLKEFTSSFPLIGERLVHLEIN